MRSTSSHSVAPAEVLATVGETGAEPRSRISTRPTPAPSQTRSSGAEVARVLDVLEQHHQIRIRRRPGRRQRSRCRTSAAMPLWAGPAISASARSGTTSNGTRWRWQASAISSRRRPARAALTSTRTTS